MIILIVLDLVGTLFLYGSIRSFISAKNRYSEIKNKLVESNLSE